MILSYDPTVPGIYDVDVSWSVLTGGLLANNPSIAILSYGTPGTSAKWSHVTGRLKPAT